MAETVTENQACEQCGVEVRPNSAFCYNCGGNIVAPKKAIPAAGQFNSLEPSFEESTAAQTSKLQKPPISETSEKANETEPKIEQKKADEPKLKSAATMRRQTKSFQRKSVEVVWEEPEVNSLWRLILVTLLLLAFVGTIVYFGVYNK